MMLTRLQFVDLCILCGCDYTKNIGNIGPTKAYQLIQKYGSIERVLKKIELDNENPNKKRKYEVPDFFPYE